VKPTTDRTKVEGRRWADRAFATGPLNEGCWSCGDGGNRTRVLRRFGETSPSAVDFKLSGSCW